MKAIILSLFLFLCNLSFADTLIKFQTGLTTLNAPIYVEKSDVVIIGEEGAVVKMANGVNAPILVIGERSEEPKLRIKNIKVFNLIFDGNMDNQTSEYMTAYPWLRNNCITVRGASDVYIENVITHHARSGGVVLEKGCTGVVINGLNAHDNFFDGFAGYMSEGCSLQNASLHHNKAAAISLDWSYNNNTFYNIHIYNNGDLGIFMRDCKANFFKDITIKYNAVFLGSRIETNPTTACFKNIFLFLNKPQIVVDEFSEKGENVFRLKTLDK